MLYNRCISTALLRMMFASGPQASSLVQPQCQRDFHPSHPSGEPIGIQALRGPALLSGISAGLFGITLTSGTQGKTRAGQPKLSGGQPEQLGPESGLLGRDSRVLDRYSGGQSELRLHRLRCVSFCSAVRRGKSGAYWRPSHERL